MKVRWQVCADDIEAVCGYERDSLDTVEGFDARVIQCLQVRAHAGLQSLHYLEYQAPSIYVPPASAVYSASESRCHCLGSSEDVF